VLFALVPLLVHYLDGSIRAFIHGVQRHWGMTLATWLSRTGHGLLDGAVGAILVAVGVLMGRPREALAGLLALFAVIGGGLSVIGLKHLFCRSRPLAEDAGQFFAVFPCVGEGYALMSFPSGHSVTSFALAYVLARTYPKASPLFYALATMVALSRVYLASHFLSDVVAGAAIGLLAGWAVCRLAHFPLEDAPR
jgi:membrane-associated phospholipid phosphatase